MKKNGVPVQPSTTPNQQQQLQQSLLDHHRRSPSMKRLTTPVLAFTPFNHTVNAAKPANASTTNEDENYLNVTATNGTTAAVEQSKMQSSNARPINYRNGRKIEPMFFSYSTYYRHKENLPQHYSSLVQYLESKEVKYHNDNLYESSPIGLPTRAQLLRERVYHLPILNDSPVEKSRYRRKLDERQQSIVTSRKKFDFTTHDNFSAHYFLTGARFNRNDTIDSKILNKYGVFVNRHKPELVYIKSPKKALQNFQDDLEKLTNPANHHRAKTYRSRSVQVIPLPRPTLQQAPKIEA